MPSGLAHYIKSHLLFFHHVSYAFYNYADISFPVYVYYLLPLVFAHSYSQHY